MIFVVNDDIFSRHHQYPLNMNIFQIIRSPYTETEKSACSQFRWIKSGSSSMFLTIGFSFVISSWWLTGKYYLWAVKYSVFRHLQMLDKIGRQLGVDFTYWPEARWVKVDEVMFQERFECQVYVGTLLAVDFPTLVTQGSDLSLQAPPLAWLTVLVD